jgi:hypothetical protein
MQHSDTEINNTFHFSSHKSTNPNTNNLFSDNNNSINSNNLFSNSDNNPLKSIHICSHLSQLSNKSCKQVDIILKSCERQASCGYYYNDYYGDLSNTIMYTKLEDMGLYLSTYEKPDKQIYTRICWNPTDINVLRCISNQKLKQTLKLFYSECRKIARNGGRHIDITFYDLDSIGGAENIKSLGFNVNCIEKNNYRISW